MESELKRNSLNDYLIDYIYGAEPLTSRHLATQKRPNIFLWNKKAHYSVHKGPVASKMDAGHATCSYFFKIHFNIILRHTYSLQGGFLLSGLPQTLFVRKLSIEYYMETKAHGAKLISFTIETSTMHLNY